MRLVVAVAVLGALGCSSDSDSDIDAALADAPPALDASPAIDADPNLSPEEACTLRYGSLAGFELCTANATACTFFAETGGQSCIDLCASFGGQCINSHDDTCGSADPVLTSCQSTDLDQVCVCSLL